MDHVSAATKSRRESKHEVTHHPWATEVADFLDMMTHVKVLKNHSLMYSYNYN